MKAAANVASWKIYQLRNAIGLYKSISRNSNNFLPVANAFFCVVIKMDFVKKGEHCFYVVACAQG